MCNDAKFSDLHVEPEGMTLTLSLTIFNGGVDIRGAGTAVIPFTAHDSAEKHVRIYLAQDGQFVVDERLIDPFHSWSKVDECVALLVFLVIPPGATDLGILVSGG